jgi:MraZ protein
MFRGQSSIAVDTKGRLAVPARIRDALASLERTDLVITLNPWDRALWLYPIAEWEVIEAKLGSLSDFDLHGRRTKQIMRGYATDCACDAQGRVLLPAELRTIAGIERQVTLLGQGNKCEIWDSAAWQTERDRWLRDVDDGASAPSTALGSLSL